MATLTKTVKIYGDPKVVAQSFSDTPVIKDGTSIVSFSINAAEYANGDDVKVVLDGAKSVQYASIKKLDGTELALTQAATTNPVGISLATGAIATAVKLWVFIICNIES